MKSHYQKGATMWTTLTFALLIGLFVYVGFKLVYVYFDYGLIKKSMQEIVNGSDFKSMTSKQVMIAMDKRLQIEGIRDFDKSAFTVVPGKAGDKYILIDYDTKVELFSNIFLLVEFNEEIRPE